jgi:predicted ATPase
MTPDNRFILTGAFGSGKSTLLEHLRSRGFPAVEEPARPILAEQRSIDGDGLPDRDARLFVELMLSRSIHEYRRVEPTATRVFFDRGIPDMLAYASLFGFEIPAAWNAARQYRYHRRVFFLAAWEQIYTTDAERTVSFQEARRFGEGVRDIYDQLGYILVDVPCLAVERRLEFILKSLSHA